MSGHPALWVGCQQAGQQCGHHADVQPPVLCTSPRQQATAGHVSGADNAEGVQSGWGCYRSPLSAQDTRGTDHQGRRTAE